MNRTVLERVGAIVLPVVFLVLAIATVVRWQCPTVRLVSEYLNDGETKHVTVRGPGNYVFRMATSPQLRENRYLEFLMVPLPSGEPYTLISGLSLPFHDDTAIVCRAPWEATAVMYLRAYWERVTGQWDHVLVNGTELGTR